MTLGGKSAGAKDLQVAPVPGGLLTILQVLREGSGFHLCLDGRELLLLLRREVRLEVSAEGVVEVDDLPFATTDFREPGVEVEIELTSLEKFLHGGPAFLQDCL